MLLKMTSKKNYLSKQLDILLLLIANSNILIVKNKFIFQFKKY